MTEICLTSPQLAATSAVRHGFFTRRGGVSAGPFDSLNAGFSGGDDASLVEENRARALEAIELAPGSIATARQVHGREVLIATEAAPGRPTRAADALVTATCGVTVAVLTADCVPVVFFDPKARVVGAAHAGWRGTLAGVVEATVGAMATLGADPGRIAAAIGPCIAQPSYEVGPELRAAFTDEDPASADLFRASGGGDRLLFDLAGAVAARLRRCGIAAVDVLGRDTHAERDLFFSSRRTRQAGGERFGLLLTAIALAP